MGYWLKKKRRKEKQPTRGQMKRETAETTNRMRGSQNAITKGQTNKLNDKQAQF